MLALAPVTLLATCLTLVQAAPAREHHNWYRPSQASSSAVASALPSGAANASASAWASASANASVVADAVVSVESTSVAPTPTSTSAAAPAATTKASSSSSSGSYNGHATYFTQGGNAGACGTVHADSDHIVAVPYSIWGGSDGQASSACGKTINIVRTSDGASVSAVVADLCSSCTSTYSIDLSVGAFTSIATESEGQVDVTWSWA